MTIYCPCCASPLSLVGLVVDGGPGQYEAKLICMADCSDEAGYIGVAPTIATNPIASLSMADEGFAAAQVVS